MSSLQIVVSIVLTILLPVSNVVAANALHIALIGATGLILVSDGVNCCVHRAVVDLNSFLTAAQK